MLSLDVGSVSVPPKKLRLQLFIPNQCWKLGRKPTHPVAESKKQSSKDHPCTNLQHIHCVKAPKIPSRYSQAIAANGLQEVASCHSYKRQTNQNKSTQQKSNQVKQTTFIHSPNLAEGGKGRATVVKLQTATKQAIAQLAVGALFKVWVHPQIR